MSGPERDDEFYERALAGLEQLFEHIAGRCLYRGVMLKAGQPPIVVFDAGVTTTGYEAAVLYMAQTVAARLENEARRVRILARETAAAGSGVSQRHCCPDMRLAVSFTCDDHPGETVWQCPDFMVAYRASLDLYGLVIHDGGESFMEIVHCPWCGARLPEGKVPADGDG